MCATPIPALGAERHADPQFVRPLRDRISDDAVGPHSGEEQRQCRENSKQQGIELRRLFCNY